MLQQNLSEKQQASGGTSSSEEDILRQYRQRKQAQAQAQATSASQQARRTREQVGVRTALTALLPLLLLVQLYYDTVISVMHGYCPYQHELCACQVTGEILDIYICMYVYAMRVEVIGYI